MRSKRWLNRKTAFAAGVTNNVEMIQGQQQLAGANDQ